MGPEALDKYISGSTGPKASPQAWLNLPILHHSFMHSEGNARKMKRYWMSLLLVPGIVVTHTDSLLDDSAYFILQTSVHGALVLPVVCKFVDGVTWICFDEGLSAADFLHLDDPHEWLVLQTAPAMPRNLSDLFGAQIDEFGLRRARLRVCGKSLVPLFEFNARLAFKQLTVPLMNRLMDEYNMHGIGSRPLLEEEVLKKLVRAVLPGIAEDELLEIVSLRRKPKPRAEYETVITEAAKHILSEVIAPDDMPEIEKKILEPAAKRRKAMQQASRVAAPSASTATDPPPAAASSSSSSSAGVVEKESASGAAQTTTKAPARALRPIDGEQFTAIEARSFLPTSPGCTASIHTGRAWQVKYPGRVSRGPKSHMVTWGPGMSHRQALLACLAWVWAMHSEATGEEPPWDLRR